MNKKLFINKTDELKTNIDSALSKTKNIHLKKKVIDKSFSSVLTRVATELLAGLIVGAVFVFILALGDFVTPQLVGGTSGFTYGKIIYSNFGMAFNWPFGTALASILLIVSVLIILLTNYLTRKT